MLKNIVDGLYEVIQEHFCDWCALDGPDGYFNRNHVFGGTGEEYVCIVYYYYSLSLTAKAAKVLGKEDDYNKYHQLAEETLQNIRIDVSYSFNCSPFTTRRID